jgi:hypothetical protein
VRCRRNDRSPPTHDAAFDALASGVERLGVEKEPVVRYDGGSA